MQPQGVVLSMITIQANSSVAGVSGAGLATYLNNKRICIEVKTPTDSPSLLSGDCDAPSSGRFCAKSSGHLLADHQF